MPKLTKRLLKNSLLFLSISITILIVILSLINITQTIAISSSDKVQHAIAYFTLSFFWLLALKDFKVKKVIILIACIALGIVLECIQGLTPHRFFEYLDMLANTVGVILGYFAFITFVKLRSQ